jgi:hypothetical protein
LRNAAEQLVPGEGAVAVGQRLVLVRDDDGEEVARHVLDRTDGWIAPRLLASMNAVVGGLIQRSDKQDQRLQQEGDDQEAACAAGQLATLAALRDVLGRDLVPAPPGVRTAALAERRSPRVGRRYRWPRLGPRRRCGLRFGRRRCRP